MIMGLFFFLALVEWRRPVLNTQSQAEAEAPKLRLG